MCQKAEAVFIDAVFWFLTEKNTMDDDFTPWSVNFYDLISSKNVHAVAGVPGWDKYPDPICQLRRVCLLNNCRTRNNTDIS